MPCRTSSSAVIRLTDLAAGSRSIAVGKVLLLIGNASPCDARASNCRIRSHSGNCRIGATKISENCITTAADDISLTQVCGNPGPSNTRSPGKKYS